MKTNQEASAVGGDKWLFQEVGPACCKRVIYPAVQVSP